MDTHIKRILTTLANLNLAYTTKEGEVKIAPGMATDLKDSATRLLASAEAEINVPYAVKQDGVEVSRSKRTGTDGYNECFSELQKRVSYSVHHALTHEGWSIEPVHA